MKRLKYEKYNNCNNVITIDLHNGYTVIAVSGLTEDKYIVTLFLKENTVDDWKLIEKAEHLEFDASYKTINSAILKQVSDFLEEGFFDYYIQRYEFYLKCFDNCNESISEESIGE